MTRPQQQQQHPSQEHQQQQSQQGSQLSQIYPRHRQPGPLPSPHDYGHGRPAAANTTLDDLSEVDCFDW